MIIVVGSGPAGVSSAMALLARGHHVTMLDVGIELENDKKKILDAIDPHANDTQILSQLKYPINWKSLNKLSYGSHYPYAEASQFLAIKNDKAVDCNPSFAQGGLSNVWGSVVEAYTKNELERWPFTWDQLNPYYQKIFPLLDSTTVGTENDFHFSRQAQHVFSNLTLHQQPLNELGFYFKKAQLAVKFNHSDTLGCNYCGSCHHGCPRKLIYSAQDTLKLLIENPHFTYKQDHIVENVSETASAIRLSVKNRKTLDKFDLQCSQVFLACGSAISTYLVLQSRRSDSQKALFADSSCFLFPCLLHRRIKQVETEKLHTLCQIGIKLHNQMISQKPINLQVYTYMDYYAEKFKQKLGRAYKLFYQLLSPFMDRLVIIQGHLDSTESHQFSMELAQSGGATLTSIKNPSVKRILKNLLTFLKAHKKMLGLTPIPSLLRISKIGRSFHYGASLPMHESPTDLQTDLYGRPTGFKRLHVVDSSVFPFIPAGPITPTIMANAYRIASECYIYETL